MGVERNPLSGIRIALVDDEPEILEELADFLRLKGYHCVVLRSGNALLRAWEERGGFDFVITDIRMPEMSGVALLERIMGASRGAAQVIVVTGHAGKEEAEQVVAAGASAVLHKPLDLNELLSLLRGLSPLWPEQRPSGSPKRLQ